MKQSCRFQIFNITGWKFLKEYLRQKHEVEALSPKAVFQACYKQNLLSQQIVEGLIELADDRNQTVHVYDQESAETICYEIGENYKNFGLVLELIKL
jgi:nucleotidyltransferase substrate binding protein (TIGR01987 family)